jgi:phage gp46-like protein
MGLYLQYQTNIDGAAFGGCDISFTNGTDIESAVLASLLTWCRATRAEVQPGDSRYGWWADTQSNTNIGSKLWLLQRAKALPTITKTAIQYAKDALQWMIDTGVAKSIDVQGYLNTQGNNSLSLQITITQNDGSIVKASFDNLWNEFKN